MTNPITIYAPAKVNLALGVTGRDAHYHHIDSYIDFTTLYDVIHLTPNTPKKHAGAQNTITTQDTIISITGEFAHLLVDDNAKHNSIIQALQFLRQHHYIEQTYDIMLEKNIPIGGGLGGGSSDGAAILRHFAKNEANFLQHHQEELLPMGADIFACYHQAPIMVQGRGEIITPYTHKYQHVILANPLIFLSTKQVFTALGKDNWQGKIRHDNAGNIILRNDLTQTACTLCPAIKKLILDLQQIQGCLHADMSGSGASCFALMNSAEAAQQGASWLQEQYYWAIATHFI